MSDVQNILASYNLEENHIYLLELIPLIEMIWAEGKNKTPEINILYHFTIEHLARLNRDSNSVEVISEDEVNRFIDRFIHERPDPQMLKDLRDVCAIRISEKTDEADRQASREAILNYCIDIAAACASQYPYKFNERIVAEEKKLLIELFAAFS